MNMKDMLAVIVGLAAGAGAISIYKFVTFVEAEGGHLWMVSLGLAAVARLWADLLLGHVNKEKKFTSRSNRI